MPPCKSDAVLYKTYAWFVDPKKGPRVVWEVENLVHEAVSSSIGSICPWQSHLTQQPTGLLAPYPCDDHSSQGAGAVLNVACGLATGDAACSPSQKP